VQFTWAADHGITDLAANPNAFTGAPWNLRLDPGASEASPYLSEFMASNTRTLKDETGQFVDWIELFNPSDTAVDLTGWSLTDDPGDLTKWRFPATNLAAGGFLVVFASGADRRNPGARLHTSFQLSAGGEYLALVRPDGVSVASEFKPTYPRQVPDLSYGVVQVPAGKSWERGASGVYFTQATPGAPNLGGTAIPGPVIEDVRHTPQVPADSEDLRVTARVRASFQAVASVTVRHRVLFGAEASLPMADDGAHGDGAAGDGVYGATLPADLAGPGQMIRYRIVATDTQGAASRWPLFPSPTTSPEYLGTVVQPTNLVTRLPVGCRSSTMASCTTTSTWSCAATPRPGSTRSRTGSSSTAVTNCATRGRAAACASRPCWPSTSTPPTCVRGSASGSSTRSACHRPSTIRCGCT
jgi:hypothetical protein